MLTVMSDGRPANGKCHRSEKHTDHTGNWSADKRGWSPACTIEISLSSSAHVRTVVATVIDDAARGRTREPLLRGRLAELTEQIPRLEGYIFG
jgi:hypothetical protein